MAACQKKTSKFEQITAISLKVCTRGFTVNVTMFYLRKMSRSMVDCSSSGILANWKKLINNTSRTLQTPVTPTLVS